MNAYEKRQDAQIGEALRLRREALGFTQAQLGKAMDVTFQQVQKYEQGRNSVRVAKLLMAGEFLKCEVGDLLGKSLKRRRERRDLSEPGAHSDVNSERP